MTLRRAPFSRALSELFAGPGALPLLREAWPAAVGPKLAARTRVVSFQDGTLVVRVPDGRWGRILHRMRRDILQRLRQTAGALAPRAIAFSEGPLPAFETPDPRHPVTVPALPADLPESIVASAAAIPDAEVREAFLSSAGRYLARTRAG